MTLPGDLFQRVVDYHDDLYRNIKTVAPAQDLLDDLSDDPAVRAIGERIAARPLDNAEASLIIKRPFEYGVSITDKPEAVPVTRFSDGSFGVWYGSMGMETTIYETVYRWRRFVTDMMPPHLPREIVTDRRVFLVRCDALLVDLRAECDTHLALVHPDDYSFTQDVGRYLVRNGQPGLITRSARCSGANTAIFTPDVLSAVRHHKYLCYRYNTSTQEVDVRDGSNTTVLVMH